MKQPSARWQTRSSRSNLGGHPTWTIWLHTFVMLRR